MKIARLLHENIETYGFVKGDKVATKDEITFLTGVPIPFTVKDFLFDGWYDEIKNKIDDLPFEENISKFKLLAPIPNPCPFSALLGFSQESVNPGRCHQNEPQTSNIQHLL